MNLRVSIFTAIIINGVITPFIDSFTVIQFFYLLIPLAIYFVVTLITLIVTWVTKNPNRTKAFYLFLAIPIFPLSQLGSTIMVYKFQKFRANKVIDRIQKKRTISGQFPTEMATTFGIHYSKAKYIDEYTISYERGFMVKEEYSSETENWKSRVWND